MEVFSEQDKVDSSSMCTANLTNIGNCSRNQTNWIELYDSTLEAVIVPCVFACILLIGVIGNALLILSFVRHKSLNTPHNALVVNLASSDFIFLLLTLPFNSVWYTIPYWPFGVTLCKVSHFAENLATAVVIATLSILSIERCLIVTGTKLWRQQKKGPLLLTLIIWVVSVIVSMPNLISANVVEREINNGTYPFCHLYDSSLGDTYTKTHVMMKFILLFCVPLAIIGSAYTIIAIHLLLRAFSLSQHEANSENSKRSIKFSCCGTKPATNRNNRWKESIDTEQTFASKISCKPDGDKSHLKKGKDEYSATKTGSPNKGVEQLQIKSKAAHAVEDDKSTSPDSCTEMTDLQQTPVLPFSFVYTGPIPAGALPHQIPRRRSKDAPATPRNIENCAAVKTAGIETSTSQEAPKPNTEYSGSKPVRKSGPEDKESLTCKESTPLNSNPSGEAKRGYKQRRQTMQSKRRRLAFTVLMLIIAFAVCWTPRYVYLLWYHFIPGYFDIFWHVFKIVGFCLCFAYSAVNPIVFYVLDNTYRSFVNKVLCTVCLKRCRSQKNASGENAMIIAERDYNATIAMTDMKSKGNVTEL